MEITGQDSGSLIKNSDLVEAWIENEKNEKQFAVFNKICSLVQAQQYSEQIRDEIMTASRLFCVQMSKKWKEVCRNRHLLLRRYQTWLQQKVWLPHCLIANPVDHEQPGPSRPRGRPPKPFGEASLKTKKRRLAELASSRTSDELRFAAEMADNATAPDQNTTLNPHQGLALYLDLDLSEHKYKVLRSVVNSVHPNFFPSLYSLNQVKSFLLPSSLIVTETSAETNLQELLELTARSILHLADLEDDSNRFELICKWGFDGSSGHSQYKHTFSVATNTDEFLFLVAFVPLRLRDLITGKDAWINSKPSSTLYCRPIKFIFQKESAALIRNEEKEMNEKISQIQNSVLTTQSGHECHVRYKMLFTMIDGSVTNILSGTNATSKCIICGATPTQMNTQSVLNRSPNVEHFNFGLSTLHCWIRFFECLLHIAYRLPIKTWQVRGNEHKQIFENTKKKIQSEFKSKMGLLVDKPKPGYGSTNDGNTARRFFLNPDISSEITGINKELIIKFSIILRVLASGYNIDIDKFRTLLDETKQSYLSLYKWYYMPSSVHKVLVHGCDIIGAFTLPIGHLSEDALEARHKEVRKHRLSHTRKTSRVDSNKDLLRILLITSEPLISSKRKIITKKPAINDSEVLKYVILRDAASTSYNLDIDLPIDQESSDSD